MLSERSRCDVLAIHLGRELPRFGVEKRRSVRSYTERHPTTTAMSAATASPPQARVSPKDGTSPSNQAEKDEEDAWSGDEDEDEPEANGARKRKRQRTERPISVSCERCKERKVCHISLIGNRHNLLTGSYRSNATAASHIAVGVYATIRPASTRSGRSLVCVPDMAESSKRGWVSTLFPFRLLPIVLVVIRTPHTVSTVGCGKSCRHAASFSRELFAKPCYFHRQARRRPSDPAACSAATSQCLARRPSCCRSSRAHPWTLTACSSGRDGPVHANTKHVPVRQRTI
jgi:hypothetical protein